MESRLVNFVIEMGFSQRKIKRIIERQVRRNENELNTIQNLIDALLAEPDEPGDDKDGDEANSEMLEPLNTMNAKFANLNVGGATPSTLADEASLPASIQDELRELRDKRTCKICMDNEINVLFTPCGHLVACEQCARSIQTCPICKMPIKTCIKTYLS